jgi:hypothetical protein
MTRDELEFLFEKYLGRGVKENEWVLHRNKRYEPFEIEIANCNERIIKISEVKKIAILLTGHIRKNSILEGVSRISKLYDIDIFVHTWDNLGLKGTETNLDAVVNEKLVQQEIDKLPNVKGFEIENNKDYIDGLDDVKGYFNFSSPEKFIKSQLYSINKTYNLLENYIKKTKTDYDLVMRFRFDSDLNEFNLTPMVIDDINNHDIIFVPNSDNNHEHIDYATSCWACNNMYYKHKLKKVHVFEHTNVICDLFAYGSVKSMKKYCSLYHEYDKLNVSFKETNLESAKIHTENLTKTDDGYKLNGYDGHLDSLYYFNCSYPERLLQKYLKDYMLVESKNVKLKLVR